MMYTFCYMRNNGSKTKTVTTNLSYALFVDVFEEVNLAQSFTVKLSATNPYENVAYHGNLTTKIDVIGESDAILGKTFVIPSVSI